MCVYVCNCVCVRVYVCACAGLCGVRIMSVLPFSILDENPLHTNPRKSAEEVRPPTPEASAEMPSTREAEKTRWNTAEVD